MAVMDYRTQDGLADYGFSLEFQPDTGWRVHIIFQPSCHNDDENLQLPYQSIDWNGRCYVNWSSRLDSLGDARTVAALWAELAWRYQRTHEQIRDNNKAAKNPEKFERLRTGRPITPTIPWCQQLT
jgi:hypothetical protein